MDSARTITAFAGTRRVATGPLPAVLRKVKPLVDSADGEPVLFFEDDTGRQVDFDFSGTTEEVVARATPVAAPVGPGRPKLGVVSREVSLLERHWAWLEAQPQGISAALRRLVDEARKLDPEKESARRAIEATSRVMTALAGNRRGFEEASRALFARDQKRFEALIRRWPKDVSAHLRRLVGRSMTSSAFDRE